jgi:hypothetical protein
MSGGLIIRWSLVRVQPAPRTRNRRPQAFLERSKEAGAVPKMGPGHYQVTIPTALCLRDKVSRRFGRLIGELACRS